MGHVISIYSDMLRAHDTALASLSPNNGIVHPFNLLSVKYGHFGKQKVSNLKQGLMRRLIE